MDSCYSCNAVVQIDFVNIRRYEGYVCSDCVGYYFTDASLISHDVTNMESTFLLLCGCSHCQGEMDKRLLA